MQLLFLLRQRLSLQKQLKAVALRDMVTQDHNCENHCLINHQRHKSCISMILVQRVEVKVGVREVQGCRDNCELKEVKR